MNNRSRNEKIDILKGIGITLVILGHISLTPASLKIWLYSFHMPLFFISSGITFSIEKYSNYRSFLRAKVKSIVIPYFCLGFFLWILIKIYKSVLQLQQGTTVVTCQEIRNFVLSLFLGYRLHHYYFSLWFLCALFSAELIFYFIVKHAKGKNIIYACTAVFSLVIQWVVFRYIQGWYWSIDTVPSAIAFLSVGYLFRLFLERNNRFFQRLWLLPVVMCGSIYSCILNYRISGRTDLYSCNIGNPIFYGVAALFGTWFVIILVSHSGEMKVMNYFGRNSLITYAFQNSFCIPVSTLITKYFADRYNLLADKITQWLLTIIFTFLLSTFLIEMINHFFPWMVGKRKKNAAY